MAGEEFNRTLDVAAEPARVWQTVTDIDRLAGWVSILNDVREEQHLVKYAAVLQDRVGPFKLKADLAIDVEVIEEYVSLRMTAAGRDRQIDSRISVAVLLEIAPHADLTSVRVSGSYQVSGRVASMGGGVIKKKAEVILDEFFGNAEKELS